MKVIAGLGNPGSKYSGTRHNAGFKVVDALAEKYGISLKRRGFGGVYGVGKAAGEELVLFKPQTYMNLSGDAVNAVCSRYLDSIEGLLIICDDVVLPLGMVRLRKRGSSGGHNGLRSIIEHFGTEFARLRVGVRGETPVFDMKSYVLSDFLPEEREMAGETFQKAVFCLEKWLSGGIEEAMRGCNKGKVKQETSSADSGKTGRDDPERPL